MAYDDERGKVGRLPFQVVKLSLDSCTKIFGVNDPSTGGLGVCTAGQRTPGQAQAATSISITLEASSSTEDGFYDNYGIHITSGAAENDVRRIIDYNGTTKVAIVDADFSNTIVNGDDYTLIRRSDACYNTRETCQDIANYDADPTIREIYLTERSSDFPINLLDETGLAIAVPCLKSVRITPPRIDIGRGLGMRSNVDVSCYDFPHADNGIDPYYLSRDYDPATQGTFWGKLLARNPFYTGRNLTVYRGYLDANRQFDTNNYRQWTYAIDKLDGILKNDMVKITAKDILKKADDKKAQVPRPSNGVVLTDFLSGDSSFSLFPTGIGDDEYPASGTARIGDEIFDFTRSGDVVTFSGARGQYGTSASDHDAGDSVQLCVVYNNANVIDIVQDFLDVALRSDTNGLGNNAGIPTAQLDIAGWTVERDQWLTANLLTRVLSKPTGVNKLLAELTEQNMFYIWWDAVAQQVKLKAVAPVRSGETLTDDENFLADSIKVWEDQNLRASQVWVYYGVRDWSEDDDKLENYANLYVQIDSAQQTSDQYGEIQVKPIISRWITTNGLAVQLAGRYINIYGRNVKFMEFDLDNKDDVVLGDNVVVSTRFLQDVDGSNRDFNMVIIEEKERQSGSSNFYKAQQFELLGTYGYIGYSHTGRMESSPASNQVVLDTRTSRWEDPSLEIHVHDGVCEGPDVDLDGISITGGDDFVEVPAWPDDCFVDHLFHIHAPGETYDGFTSIITAYNATTKVVTLQDDLPVGVNLGVSTGDIYHVHLPEYTGSYILLEDGFALLLEDGGFMILEEGATQGATNEQKAAYMWICPDPPPDPPVFDDGSEAYKIL